MKNARRLQEYQHLWLTVKLRYYLISVVKTVIHEPGDERGLPNCANTTTGVLNLSESKKKLRKTAVKPTLKEQINDSTVCAHVARRHRQADPS